MRIIQIGANKGNTDNDPVWKLVQKNLPESLNWYIECYEPNPIACNILRETYRDFKNIEIYQLAVSNNIGKVDLFIDNYDNPNHAGSQHASLYKEHLKKMRHREEVISKIKVYSITLDNIFDQQKDLVDYLQIDTEGHDGEILLYSSYIKNGFVVKKIQFEHIHMNRKDLTYLKQMLKENNYKLTNITTEDYIYMKEDNE